MAKNKSVIDETSRGVIVENAKVLPVEEGFDFTSLNAVLTEILKTQEIIGYILRSKTLATVNLAEPDKIVDYALLTAQTIDHANTMTELFNVGKVESLLLESEKVKKYLKLSLLLWIPVLINLALVRDLLEIGTNIGGIARLIFTVAQNNKIDFIFIFIPILALDLLILYLLGVNIPGFFRRIADEVKSLFGDK